jgi:hypothetical protein
MAANKEERPNRPAKKSKWFIIFAPLRFNEPGPADKALPGANALVTQS